MTASSVTGLPALSERAVLFPSCCFVCRGITGPYWDTGNDWQDLHIYICRSCMKRGNKELGYVKGERMEALDKASDRLADAESERDEANAAATKMANELTRVQALLEQRSREVESFRDREAQLVSYAQQAGGMLNQMLVTATST